MQKYYLVFSFFVTALVGAASYPLLARTYSTDEFATITILFFLNGFFSFFDFLRPAIVKELHKFSSADRVNINNFVFLSARYAFFSSTIVFFVFCFILDKRFTFHEAVVVSASSFLFLIYSVWWAVFEFRQKVGLAALIRMVGFLFFTVGVLINHFLNINIAPAFYFVLSHILVFLCFIFIGSRMVSLSASNTSASNDFAKDVLFTLPQNIAKLIIDFSDRTIISVQGSPVLVSLYNSLYDVSAKSNILSQLYTMYNWPRLCRGEVKIQHYLSFGLFISIILASISFLLIPFNEVVVSLYLGSNFSNESSFLSVFFMVASLYSLAFFSQGALRSVDCFNVLALHFSLCAIAGLILMLILYFLYGVSGVLLSLLVLKSPGLIGMLYLRNKLGLGVRFDLLLTLYVGLLTTFVAVWWSGQ